MDHRLLGLFESLIDNYSSPDQIRLFVKAAQDFKPYIKSEGDFVFGWLMGVLEAGFTGLIFSTEKRAPTKEELGEVHSILKRRGIELINRINKEIMR